ncbi:hypothetical protein ACH5RR_038012 [Cinchona calisaya]|uniref:PHD finger protein n=1 Tax=Cinchona calisaya TaxID=153742 RepID=A0ABD2Y7U1_9GENT
MDSVEFGVKLGEKRPAEDGIGGRDVPAAKKARKEGDLIGSMRKVAEMVLVLSAIGKMRGGKVPSEVEKEIMAAAREKLAEVCELFPPKDVFPMDVFGRLIDDLGLNKVREQRLGFRPPKITIAEKLLLSKRKMEKAENFTLPSAQHSLQRLHTNSGVALENRAPPQAGRVFATDKPSNTPVSSGSFQSSPLGHVAGTNVTSLPYQLPTSEVRPMAPSGLLSSHLARDATPLALTRIDRPHFRLDGTNGSLHTSQAQANSSGNHNSVKMPPWSVQPQSASSPKIGAEKVPGQTTVKVERATDAKSGIAPQNATSKPFISQITSGNQAVSVNQHLHGVNTTPAPIPRNYHTEIGKIVQKLLQPPVSERPAWTLPSRNYMNKALTCQTCKSTINDADTVLVCDACEKGYHLKCLHINNPKGIPKAEWHCAKCLQLSNGKPLPPKYGRVMRNISFPKMSAGALDEKVNQQKILANGNAAIQRSPTGNAVSNHSSPTSTSKVVNASQMQGNAIVVEGEMDDKSSSQIYLNNLAKSSCPTTISPNSSSIKRPCEEKLLQLKPHPPKSEAVLSFSASLQSPANPEDNHPSGQQNSVGPLQQSLDNHLMDKYPKESFQGESLCNNMTEKPSQEDQGTVRTIPAETSAANSGHAEHGAFQLDYVHIVDWINGILKVDGEKAFYQSCCINGVVYKLQDHVLIRFNDRLIPSKLQAMWEDVKTKSKWVTVNKCYFPGDLPQAVGRPCGLESSEVYESTIGCTVMAGLIQGPCKVLPPGRFTEEKEKRSTVGKRPNESLRPLYLCKWIYDKPKGLFRDVNC